MARIKRKKNRYISDQTILEESIRTLRTNLSFSSVDKENKVFLVTSSKPEEGKSTISVGLARSIALNGEKVLLIDCDFRNPSISKISKNYHKEGLVDYLVNGVELRDVKIKDDMVLNLELILAGIKPPNPSEILGSKKFKTFIDGIKKHYSYVIIDTPPVGVLTDAAIVSTMVDGVVMVVSQNKTTDSELDLAMKNLKNVGANIVGFVFNKVDIKNIESYGYGKE